MTIYLQPTALHKLLDLNTNQPFDFLGDTFYLDVSGALMYENRFIGVQKVVATSAHLTNIINNQGEILRYRGVDLIGRLRSMQNLGMNFILKTGDWFYICWWQSLVNILSVKQSALDSSPLTMRPEKSSELYRELGLLFKVASTSSLYFSGDISSGCRIALSIDDFIESNKDHGPYYAIGCGG